MWKLAAQRLHVGNRITDEDVNMLCSRYPVEPAIIENALKQAKLIAPKTGFIHCVERMLKAHMTLKQGGRPFHPSRIRKNEYDLACVCTENPIDALLVKYRKLDKALREDGENVPPRMGTTLFYGPPGTGKSELAKYIASELNRPYILQRSSDILSYYVGETEKNIAATFARAESKGAVLVINEADSFLQQRSSSEHSWERTQVNEFLTALERYVGFCICTTNLYKDIDAGVIRRFTHKIRFEYAKRDQLETLYMKLLAPLVDDVPDKVIWEKLMKQRFLTPGDFSVVRNQFKLEDEGSFSHMDMLNALLQEQKLKLDADTKRIGFNM